MQKLNKRAFTLLELVVVISIVTILAILVLPVVNRQIDKAKFSKVKSDLDGYIKAVNLFYTDNNRYPTNKEELESYMTRKSIKNPYNGEYLYNGVGDIYLDVTKLPQDVKISLMNELKRNSAIVDENYRYYFKASFLNKSVDELIQEEGYIPLANVGDVKAMDGTITHTFAQGTQYEVTKDAGTYGLDSKYILVDDIELDGSYTPHSNFAGILNGNGHKITGEGALFNSNNGELINLELEEVNIQNQAVVIDKDIAIQNVRDRLQQNLQGLATTVTINWTNIADDIKNNVSNVSNIEFRNMQTRYNTEGNYTVEFRVTFSDNAKSEWLRESFYVIQKSDCTYDMSDYIILVNGELYNITKGFNLMDKDYNTYWLSNKFGGNITIYIKNPRVLDYINIITKCGQDATLKLYDENNNLVETASIYIPTNIFYYNPPYVYKYNVQNKNIAIKKIELYGSNSNSGYNYFNISEIEIY